MCVCVCVCTASYCASFIVIATNTFEMWSLTTDARPTGARALDIRFADI